MTHEPTGDEIPELAGRLEDSLVAPNPSAIHAGLGQRQAARKRTIGITSAFVVFLGIIAGVLALTNDDTTSTFTAADDVADVSAEQPMSAVADDSAPIEFENWSSSGALRDLMMSDVWSVGDTTGVPIGTPGLPTGFIPRSGRVWFENASDALSNGPAFDSFSYSTGCDGSAYEIKWNDSGFTVLGEVALSPNSRVANCFELPYPHLTLETGEKISITDGVDPFSMTMGRFCRPRSRCSADSLWSVDLIGTSALPSNDYSTTTEAPALIADVVVDEQCSNSSTLNVAGHQWLAWELPPEWEGQGVVQVAVVIDDAKLIATDENGLTAPFVRNDGQDRIQPCVGFTYEQPTTTAAVAIPTPIMPRLPPPETTTTTAAPPETTTTAQAPTGPPAFAPSEDTDLSGAWTVVGLWRNGTEVDLAEFAGRVPIITILEQRLGGTDGCNDHGGALLRVNADGTASTRSGTSTAMACPDNFAQEVAGSAIFSATQWGRTSSGNLVLVNGEDLAEFELTG